MTLPTANEHLDKLISDSKTKKAALTDTLNRETKPLLALSYVFYLAILFAQYSHPSLLGTVMVTIFCIFSSIMFFLFLRAMHNIKKEDEFQKRISQ